MTRTRTIGFYLRHTDNLHYFAALKPYIDYYVGLGVHTTALVLKAAPSADQISPDYVGYRHLFTVEELDSYDLVLTPTFLRPDERSKHTRAVQVFHGMSDKPFTYERDFSDYLMCLCVGQLQAERLLRHEHNRAMRYAMIGYPKFDRIAALPRLFKNARKTVIYCPTWRKAGLSSLDVFLSDLEALEMLKKHYNVIVKPHPNVFSPARPFYDESIVARLRALDGVTLVCSGNAMPYFSQADLFIGDISASGYEWLYFGRPMVFLNPQPDVLRPSVDIADPTFLWQCGRVCDDTRTLTSVIEASLADDVHQDVRETILDYCVFRARDGHASTRGIAATDALIAAC